MGTKQTRRTSADARTGPARAPGGSELGEAKVDFKIHKGLRQAAAPAAISLVDDGVEALKAKRLALRL